MNKKTYMEKLMYNKISVILLKEWDPIGIQDIPEAQDEYQSYVHSILQLLISKKSEAEIFSYLWWIETEHMGLEGDKQHTAAITRKLLQIFDGQ